MQLLSLSPYLQSRIHRLNTIPSIDNPCYIKRDDELSFGCSGCKKRKYASLIHFLLKNAYHKVFMLGGAFSNNVLSLLQYLIENNIDYHLLLLGPPHKNIGNALYTQLLSHPDNITWISRLQWHLVHQKAKELQASEKSKSFIIPEGASCIESLPGALTLGQDIERNEKEYTLCFKHLFIESGSGFSAYALALYAYLFKKPWKIHCLILADKSKQEFLNRCMSWLQTPEHQESLAYLIPFFPLTNASFGSTSPSNFNFIRDIAQREGFLIDPIYSAKLLKESNLYIKDNRLIPSSCCIIHSGGALSLSGFSSQLQQLLSK